MNEMVTISRIEYDRLVCAEETLADLDIVAQVKARLEAGEDEFIPASFANRILDGENPVRVYREFRGHSGVELARLAGVNRVQLLNIEAGKSTGSVSTMKKLADALKVQIDDLI
jgi:DNA-binding XRE family transcriptional regulator